MKRLLILLVLLMTTGVMAQDDEPLLYRDSIPSLDTIQFEVLVDELVRPLYVTHANDDSGRLFIVEQGGRIKVWDGDTTSMFLDISDLVSPDANAGGYTERGLLGLAFHPDYAENGTF